MTLTHQRTSTGAHITTKPASVVTKTVLVQDGAHYPLMVPIDDSPESVMWADLYVGNAHAEAEAHGILTCLDPVIFALGDCVACEVEDGTALMVVQP